MYLKARLAVVVCTVAFAVPSFARQAFSHATATTEPAVVECTVLEAHASAAPAVLVVIFHQEQKKDQPRLAALIKVNSGSDADIQIGSAPWTRATIFRLRTCFGRGMMVLSPRGTELKDGETFRIRFSNVAPK